MSWERIDLYRNHTGASLDEVATAIGVGKSMLMMVKSGKRKLSKKALHRLEQAEIEAGIRPSTTPNASSLEEEIVTIRDTLLEIKALLSTIVSRLPSASRVL